MIFVLKKYPLKKIIKSLRYVFKKHEHSIDNIPLPLLDEPGVSLTLYLNIKKVSKIYHIE